MKINFDKNQPKNLSKLFFSLQTTIESFGGDISEIKCKLFKTGYYVSG